MKPIIKTINSWIYLFILLGLTSCVSKIGNSSKENNSNTEGESRKVFVQNKFIPQDSLIVKNNKYDKVAYFGYQKNNSDTSKYDDIIKIYHIHDNDTLLSNSFVFYRDEYESNIELINHSKIPKNENRDGCIILAIFKGNDVITENYFKYDTSINEYIFSNRISFYKYDSSIGITDTIGLSCNYNLDMNVMEIDSLKMSKIFADEHEGEYKSNCKWILSK